MDHTTEYALDHPESWNKTIESKIRTTSVEHRDKRDGRETEDPDLDVLEARDELSLVKVESSLGRSVGRQAGNLDVEVTALDELAGGGVVGDELIKIKGKKDKTVKSMSVGQIVRFCCIG